MHLTNLGLNTPAKCGADDYSETAAEIINCSRWLVSVY
jgi:hypothetical protein